MKCYCHGHSLSPSRLSAIAPPTAAGTRRIIMPDMVSSKTELKYCGFGDSLDHQEIDPLDDLLDLRDEAHNLLA